MNIEISEEIKSLIPYKPGKPLSEAQREYGIKDFVKLASNECPIPPSENILKAIQEAAKEIHRYPDPACYDLRQVASKYYQAPGEKFVFGNGSNELIDLLIRAFCKPGDCIVTPKYSFVAYRICAQAFGVRTLESDLKPGFHVDLDAISHLIESSWNCPKIIFIPNPNNPTGTYINKTELDAFLKKWGHREDFLIVFDEAYTEFVRAKDYPFGLASSPYKNVVVLKTMSKVFALAGLRIGAMIADPFIIDIINRIRNPFNVNSLAQAAAIAAFQDTDFLN
jgi:histidinol-phosphate aminotransferase